MPLAGDLVQVHWGPHPELEYVNPTQWFDSAVKQSVALLFVKWVTPGLNDGWAHLLHPDGSIKIVHSDYFLDLRTKSEG